MTVVTTTIARSASMSGVVICTVEMCTGSVMMSQVSRWMPVPVYQRESWCDRASTRIVLVSPYRRYGSRGTTKPV